tara:strand:- start:2534 stop:2827 length:294 start_codon:yes stop_codon:yes gene_type:complete
MFVSTEVSDILLNFAKVRLTKKQKELLSILRSSSIIKKRHITQMVQILTTLTNSSSSTIWFNMNQLRAIGLVEFGKEKTKGKPLELTKIGKWVAKHV